VNFLARAGLAAGLVLSLSGCLSMSNDAPVVAAATPGVVAPAAPAAAPPPPPSYAGLIDGSLGASLNANDRTAANKAEVAALASGERRTWRGDDGSYGYVAPAAGGGDCRDFVHTVYINGRPKVGKGSACRQGDSWKLNG